MGDAGSFCWADGEVFDPVAERWELLPGDMMYAREGHALVAVAAGGMIAIGGTMSREGPDELFDVENGQWIPLPYKISANLLNMYAGGGAGADDSLDYSACVVSVPAPSNTMTLS